MANLGRPIARMGTHAHLMTQGGLVAPVPAPRATYGMRCLAPDGGLKWAAAFHNLVTNEGKDELLDIMFDAATQIST
ncbi:MAG: hypothetical protein RIM84_26110 [Alphaproteobacteria bacterium]